MIAAVIETHLQADHVSGVADLVLQTDATAYVREGTGVEFDHHALTDRDVVTFGNTEWLLTLPDHLALSPAHYSEPVCGRGPSANPIAAVR